MHGLPLEHNGENGVMACFICLGTSKTNVFFFFEFHSLYYNIHINSQVGEIYSAT